MENRCLQALIYPRLGFILLFLAGIGYCEQSSSSFPKLDSHKYIAKAYFQKYDTLVDQIFQDFLAYELSLGFCEDLQSKNDIFPRLSVVKRQLLGEGSHRRLTSSIIFVSQPQVFSKLPPHFCEAIIVERLPSGVFADPFELQHLMQRGVFMDASAFGDIDLELPTVRADRSIVEIHMDLGHNALSGNKNGLELKIELPLHARYAPLGDHGYARVEFGSPDLFVRCNTEENSDCQSCIFSSIDNNITFNDAPIVWEIPCGIMQHTKIVSVLTFISAVVSAFFIFLASFYYSGTAGCSHSKHS